jgi:hypothetical protein
MAILAHVRGPNGFHRPVTDDDALWAARALLGEASRLAWTTDEGYAILWTMLNRWVLTAKVLPPMSYGEFLQRYCKPINPRWLHGGSFDPNPEVETDEERRRVVRRGLGWHQMSPELRKVVYAVLTGKVPAGPYAGLVHFSAPGGPVAPGAIPASLPSKTANVFFKIPQTLGWKSSTVTVNAESTSQTVRYAALGFGVGMLAVGLAAGPAHEAIKKWRKPLPPQRGEVHRSKKEYVRAREKRRERREEW